MNLSIPSILRSRFELAPSHRTVSGFLRSNVGQGFIALADQVLVSGGRFAASVLVGRLCGKEPLGFYTLGFTVLLIMLCLFIRKVTNFDPGREQIQSLAKIVAYAIVLNVFFFLCEVFVAFYSNIPEHMDHIIYLFAGLHGHGAYVPWMWASMILMLLGIILLVTPMTRKNEATLAVGCLVIFIGTWIDKGMGMISGGFVPNPLHEVNEYIPTVPEVAITLGVYGIGALVLTTLFKMAVSVKEEVKG